MQDMIIAGTGNSRFLKSSIDADITLSELVSMLRAGTFPFDFNGVNPAGITQEGTPLNTATLLSDDTAEKIWGTVNGDPTVNLALAARTLLTGSSAPTTSTVGAIGQFYWDTVDELLFLCTGLNSGQYIWNPVTGEKIFDENTSTPAQTINFDVSDIDFATYDSFCAELSYQIQSGDDVRGRINNQAHRCQPFGNSSGWSNGGFFVDENANDNKTVKIYFVKIADDAPLQTFTFLNGSYFMCSITETTSWAREVTCNNLQYIGVYASGGKMASAGLKLWGYKNGH